MPARRLPAFAADAPIRTSPAKAPPSALTDERPGPDFKIQGEYVGRPLSGNQVGAQVIADGDGQFSGRMLRGGLPGAGWEAPDQIRFKAKPQNGKTRFEFTVPNGPSVKCTFEDGKLR